MGTKVEPEREGSFWVQPGSASPPSLPGAARSPCGIPNETAGLPRRQLDPRNRTGKCRTALRQGTRHRYYPRAPPAERKRRDAEGEGEVPVASAGAPWNAAAAASVVLAGCAVVARVVCGVHAGIPRRPAGNASVSGPCATGGCYPARAPERAAGAALCAPAAARRAARRGVRPGSRAAVAAARSRGVRSGVGGSGIHGGLDAETARAGLPQDAIRVAETRGEAGRRVRRLRIADVGRTLADRTCVAGPAPVASRRGGEHAFRAERDTTEHVGSWRDTARPAGAVADCRARSEAGAGGAPVTRPTRNGHARTELTRLVARFALTSARGVAARAAHAISTDTLASGTTGRPGGELVDAQATGTVLRARAIGVRAAAAIAQDAGGVTRDQAARLELQRPAGAVALAGRGEAGHSVVAGGAATARAVRVAALRRAGAVALSAAAVAIVQARLPRATGRARHRYALPEAAGHVAGLALGVAGSAATHAIDAEARATLRRGVAGFSIALGAPADPRGTVAGETAIGVDEAPVPADRTSAAARAVHLLQRRASPRPVAERQRCRPVRGARRAAAYDARPRVRAAHAVRPIAGTTAGARAVARGAPGGRRARNGRALPRATCHVARLALAGAVVVATDSVHALTAGAFPIQGAGRGVPGLRRADAGAAVVPRPALAVRRASAAGGSGAHLAHAAVLCGDCRARAGAIAECGQGRDLAGT
jgi:hypothetical protein